MNPKYQIFVSSTYTDLKEQRDQVIKAVLEMGHIPVGMEMFSAADEEQWQIIARQIDQSDYYVVLVAHRYGSVTDEGIGYTEKEYDYAVSQKVPVLGFVIEADADWPAHHIERDPKANEALERFKQKVKSKPVGFWHNADELHGKVSIALSKAFNTNPRPGWVRATQAVSPETATEIARLSSKNAELREQVAHLQQSAQNSAEEVDANFEFFINHIPLTSKPSIEVWPTGSFESETALFFFNFVLHVHSLSKRIFEPSAFTISLGLPFKATISSQLNTRDTKHYPPNELPNGSYVVPLSYQQAFFPDDWSRLELAWRMERRTLLAPFEVTLTFSTELGVKYYPFTITPGEPKLRIPQPRKQRPPISLP